MAENGKGFILAIGAREGAFNGITENRTYTAKVRLDKAPLSVTVDGEEKVFSYADGFATFEIGKGKAVEVAYGY
jgi:hypothetical protein